MLILSSNASVKFTFTWVQGLQSLATTPFNLFDGNGLCGENEKKRQKLGLTQEEIQERLLDLKSYGSLRKRLEEKGPKIIEMLNIAIFDGEYLPKHLSAPILELTAQATFLLVHPRIPFIPEFSESDFIERMKINAQADRVADIYNPLFSKEPVLLPFIVKKLEALIPITINMGPTAVFFMTLLDVLHDLMNDLMTQIVDDHPELFD